MSDLHPTPALEHVPGRGLPNQRQTSFLLGIGLGLAGLARTVLHIEQSPWDNAWKPDVDRPPSARGRRGYLGRTLSAILDAVLPGCSSDPEGLPGANEVRALDLLLDPPMVTFYHRRVPTRPYLWAVVLVTDLQALLRTGRPYRYLPLEKRCQLLLSLLRWAPLLYEPVVTTARYAYLGGPLERHGLEALGNPGPCDRQSPLLDFDPTERPREATSTGSLP